MTEDELKALRERKLVFPCCFCGEHEPEQADRGLVTTDLGTGDSEQQWFCHISCLLERMVPQARDAYVGDASDAWEPPPVE